MNKPPPGDSSEHEMEVESRLRRNVPHKITRAHRLMRVKTRKRKTRATRRTNLEIPIHGEDGQLARQPRYHRGARTKRALRTTVITWRTVADGMCEAIEKEIIIHINRAMSSDNPIHTQCNHWHKCTGNFRDHTSVPHKYRNRLLPIL